MASFIIDKSIDQIINKYAKQVMNEIKVKNIYLYGSYAKGTYNEDSDIDIAVISDDFIGDPIEDTLKLMRIRRKVDYRIEPHPFKSSDVDMSEPYVRNIIKNGIKII